MGHAVWERGERTWSGHKEAWSVGLFLPPLFPDPQGAACALLFPSLSSLSPPGGYAQIKTHHRADDQAEGYAPQDGQHRREVVSWVVGEEK